MTTIDRVDQPLIDAIDAVLPQTQCTQCGYDGCRPYAEAIATGRAEINQCPPGGDVGIVKLAAVTGRAPIAPNTTHGVTKPLALALIDEAICIGCTLCIQACPVDAIVGGAKRMHDVVAELCTGCELCLPPCPVDCITMVPAGFAWDDRMAADARTRHERRNARLLRASRGAEQTSTVVPTSPRDEEARRRRSIIEAAVARALQARAARTRPSR